jgi:peptide chain release factor 1
MSDLLSKLEAIHFRFIEVGKMITDPDIISDMDRFVKLSKEYRELEELESFYKRYSNVLSNLSSGKELLEQETDPEMREMAKEEIDALEQERPALEEEIKMMLIPKDPEDDKNAIVELRAGTGGDEACIFVEDIFRMYTMYFKEMGWQAEVINSSEGTTKGFKEISIQITGAGIYGAMKFESGVHRVQRVPETESQGRIHTSAAGVLILAEADEVDIEVRQQDLRIDVYRSSGPGGQSVNTTDSAVRITHIPTGVVVSCQNEKSQLQNKESAMRILRARLLAHAQEQADAQAMAERKSQVRTVDRSERIRTYNFPENRLSDHRVNFKSNNLDAVLNGDLDPVIEALLEADKTAKLASGDR